MAEENTVWPYVAWTLTSGSAEKVRCEKVIGRHRHDMAIHLDVMTSVFTRIDSFKDKPSDKVLGKGTSGSFIKISHR